MRKFSIILISVLMLTVLLAIPTPLKAQTTKVVGLDLKPGRVWRDFWTANMVMDNLTTMGYDVRNITSITAATLADLDALVIGKQDDYDSGYSAAEITAIKDWFNQGNKFLWTGADSDYAEPHLNASDTSFKSKEPNKILAAVESNLRYDHGSIEDAGSMIGAPYRPMSNVSNSDGWANDITKNTVHVLFHGPSLIVGYKDGNLVSIDGVQSNNLKWLYKSSPLGTVVSNDGVDPDFYDVGYEGVLCEAAAQKLRVTWMGKYSKLMVTSESLLGDRCVLTQEYHGVSLDGYTFVEQAFAWGLTSESVPYFSSEAFSYFSPTIVIIIVIAAIVVVVVFFYLRRR